MNSPLATANCPLSKSFSLIRSLYFLPAVLTRQYGGKYIFAQESVKPWIREFIQGKICGAGNVSVKQKSLLIRNRGSLPLANFFDLADIPPEVEWFANIDNANTRRAYGRDVKEFMAFAAVATSTQLRLVTRAHVIAWRQELEGKGRN